MAYPGVSYRFEAKGVKPEKPLLVAHFKATGKISELYRYEIVLKTKDDKLKPAEVLKAVCSFTTIVYDDENTIYGVLESFEQLDSRREYKFYKAILRPKIWKLTQIYTNQVFVEKSHPETIEEILKENGFKSTDYEFKLNGKMSGFSKEPPYKFDAWKYRKYYMVCQYKETCMDFIQRVCDHEGIYYYFVQEKNQDKIIFCDAMTFQEGHKSSAGKAYGKVFYYQDSGFDDPEAGQMIQELQSEIRTVPKKVVLEDYDYLKPSLAVQGEAVVDKDGIGEHYSYGDYFETPEEGKRLAKIRAEMYLCRKEIFHGRGTTHWLNPGSFFDLDGHELKPYNQKYCVTELRQEGVNHSEDAHGDYKSFFTLIPSKTQFRPVLSVKKIRIDGSMKANVDAAGSGKYAELDEHGRYKVIIPFDNKSRQAGKASAWLRMSQPHAGEKEGFHFPLHKGTEVLISFLNGDPNRPIIVNSIPNAETPNVVKDENQSMHVILTRADNYFEMEDKEKSLGILMRTPQSLTYTYWGYSREKMGEGIVSKTDGKKVAISKKGRYRTITVEGAEGKGTKFPAVSNSGKGADGSFEEFDTNISDYDAVKDCIVSNIEGERYEFREGTDHIMGPTLEVNYGPAYVEVRAKGKEKEKWAIPGVGAKFEKGRVKKTWAEVIQYHKGDLFDWHDKSKEYHFLKRHHEWYKSEDKSAGKGASKDSGKGDFVRKFFGDTYEYRKGKTKTVSVGDFASEQYGKVKIKIEGKVEINSKGDVKVKIDGKVELKITKNLKVTVEGSTSQKFMKKHETTYMKDLKITAMKAATVTYLDKLNEVYNKDVMRVYQKTQIEMDNKPIIAKRDNVIEQLKTSIAKMNSSIKDISGVNMMKASTHLLM